MKLILAFCLLLAAGAPIQTPLNGAWEHTAGNQTTVLLFEDGYFTATTYTPDSFITAYGGRFSTDANSFRLTEEFNTMGGPLSGKVMTYTISGADLTLDGKVYRQIDDGKAPLSGVWKITGRQQDGKMNQIHQRGTRKTLKMLTATRFQWFAIDPDGNKFYGTGGGTYTFADGRYTEHITFFSRDASRVGASLSFDGKLQEGKWHHSGLSSRGDQIYEVWEKALQ